MAGGNKGIMTEQPRTHFISAHSALPVKDSAISPNDKPARDSSPLIYRHKYFYATPQPLTFKYPTLTERDSSSVFKSVEQCSAITLWMVSGQC